MIIGIAGHAGAGKDTLGNYLAAEKGFHRLAFADPIREIALKINPIITVWPGEFSNDEDETFFQRLKLLVDAYGWDNAKEIKEVRKLLQDLGEGARDVLGEKVWIDETLKRITSFQRRYGVEANIAITDVRRRNEEFAIRSRFLESFVVRIDRPGHENGVDRQHSSEREVSTIGDYVIINDGTIVDLLTKIHPILEGK